MARRVFAAGSVANATGAPLRLVFYTTQTGTLPEKDLWTVDGAYYPSAAIPNGVILTDSSGAYSGFAGPDDIDSLWIAPSNGAARTQITATRAVASAPTADTTAATLAADSAFTGTFAQPLKPGGALWAIGDSITDNGNAAAQTGAREGTGGLGGMNFSPVSYLAHTLLNCGGRFRLGGVSATAGYTAAQIRDTLLPIVLAARPAACIVLAGTNGATDLSGTTAALTTIYTSMRAAGIAPVLCTIPPQGTSTPTTPAAIYALNSWIKSYASANGLVCADIYAATTDSTTGIYTSGYSDDGVHPTATGAEVMGRTIATALAGAFWQPAAPLAAANITQQSMHANPLMLADADSDGIPDGWNLLIGLGTSAVAIPTVTGVAGKTLTETRNDTDVLLSSAAYLTFTAGHRYRFGCMLRGTASGGTQSWSLRLEASDGSGFLVSFLAFTNTTPLTPLVFEFTVPSGLGVYTYVLRPWARGASGAKLEIGQVTIYDLTAAGLA